jgi:hypothetical protein
MLRACLNFYNKYKQPFAVTLRDNLLDKNQYE